MEPISIRKLDKFYGQDRRIINTGLLRSEANYQEDQISDLSGGTDYNLAKNYSRRSLLNYDGNSLFAGYGSSFYNPFFNKVFLNYVNAPNSPYYGYLLKTSRDIITLPVYSPHNNPGNAIYDYSEFQYDANIWNDYIGKDDTMEHYGLFLRSDGHYIMSTSDIIDNNMNKENNANVFYYIPFYSRDMYGKQQPFELCPEGYINIIIGPPDIFTIGQTYYALLDFEPYLFSAHDSIDNIYNIYCAIRMATKSPQTLGGYVYNRINTHNYINSCAYINITNDRITNNSDNTRYITVIKRHPYDYSMNRNTLMYIKAGADKTKNQEYRNSMAVLLEWKWGLRNSPFSVARNIEEQIFVLGEDTLSTAGLSSGVAKETYYCQFLEIKASVVQGIDFIKCNKLSDYSFNEIKILFGDL